MSAASVREVSDALRKLKDEGCGVWDERYLSLLRVLKGALVPPGSGGSSSSSRLCAQVAAYRRLVRNACVPPEMLREVGVLSVAMAGKSWTNVNEGACWSTPASQQSQADAVHASQRREARVRNKLQYRAEELRVLWPLLREKPTLELRLLAALDLQKRFRAHIAQDVRNAAALECVGDLACWTRVPYWGASSEVEPLLKTVAVTSEQSRAELEAFLDAVKSRAEEMWSEREERRSLGQRLVMELEDYHRKKASAAKAAINQQKVAEIAAISDPARRAEAIKEAKEKRLRECVSVLEESAVGKDVVLPPAYRGEAVSSLSSQLQCPFQVEGAKWLLERHASRRSAVLADDFGLGSDSIVGALLSALLTVRKDAGPFLVLAPITETTLWIRQLGSAVPFALAVHHTGTAEERTATFLHQVIGRSSSQPVVLVCSHNLAIEDAATLCSLEWGAVILVESPVPQPGGRCWPLDLSLLPQSAFSLLVRVGAPAAESPEYRWNAARFLFANELSCPGHRDHATPQEWALCPLSGCGASLTPEEHSALEVAVMRSLTTATLRRTSEEVATQLPQRIEFVLRCSMSAMQRYMYQNMCESGVMLLDPSSARAVDHQQHGLPAADVYPNVVSQLARICQHPRFFLQTDNLSSQKVSPRDLIRSSGKLEALDHVLYKLLALGRRVMVTVRSPDVADAVYETVISDPVRAARCSRLYENTDLADVASFVEAWNRPASELSILVLVGASNMEGCLVGLDDVLTFDADWVPVVRISNGEGTTADKRDLRVYRMMTMGSVEEELVAACVTAESLDDEQEIAAETRKDLQMKLLTKFSTTEFDFPTNPEDDKSPDSPIVSPGPHLNRLLARNAKDLALLYQIDAEQELKARQGGPSRLLEDGELPDWMLGIQQSPYTSLELSRAVLARKALQEQPVAEPVVPPLPMEEQHPQMGAAPSALSMAAEVVEEECEVMAEGRLSFPDLATAPMTSTQMSSVDAAAMAQAQASYPPPRRPGGSPSKRHRQPDPSSSSRAHKRPRHHERERESRKTHRRHHHSHHSHSHGHRHRHHHSRNREESRNKRPASRRPSRPPSESEGSSDGDAGSVASSGSGSSSGSESEGYSRDFPKADYPDTELSSSGSEED